MSTSDLYLVNGKSVRHVAEFRNGWGTAPVVWEHLYDTYLYDPLGPEVHSMHKWDKSWKLHDDDRLTAAERTCLLMTFDYAYVPLDKLEDTAWLCDEFGILSEDGERVNHWRAVGRELFEASKQRWGRHARGIALNCTSVADIWIDAYPSQIKDKAWSIYEDDA